MLNYLINDWLDTDWLACQLEHVMVADPASYDAAANSVSRYTELTCGRVVYCQWAERPTKDGITVLVIHVQPPLLQ